MNIQIIKSPILKKDLEEIAKDQFNDWVKAVIDIEQKIMAIGGDLHADEEALLLENGSSQENLWGANLWFTKNDNDRIEFDSMINIRPAQGNRTRNVENQKIRDRMQKIINELIMW